MARLNEPVTSMESLESLKRKFMRQNRDIARANSTQSLRIRNLENEISRLLAENLGLREQILKLHNEAENGQAQRIADHTGAVKTQLEAKLLELTELISGLGIEPKPRKESPKGKTTRPSPGRSPNQKNWKNMCTLSEAVADQEGRLPPIMENKQYPRRTLERQEIIDITASAEEDTTDSPEIGPPPVSQFVDEDPVKIDFPKRSQKDGSEEISGLDPALSVNLEQRRKRKDSIGASELRRASRTEPASGAREGTGSLKAGAKRKLGVRDDDEDRELFTRPTEISPDDFKFTRVTSEDRTRKQSSHQPEKSMSKATRDLVVARGAPREKSTSTVPPNRKVLAPKSVNDSPRKSGRSPVYDEIKPSKPDAPKPSLGKERRERRQEPVKIQAPVDLPVNAIEVQLEPETPAGLDILSPSSSRLSPAREESRDTPPPPDLGPGIEGARPSRRARGAVSYAEPNLRDKMRRPTKEMTDAVLRDEKASRGGFVKLEDGSIIAVKIKAEPEAEDAWKHMPVASSATEENSPLRSKAPAPEVLPNSISTHRKRRESILSHGEIDGQRSTSGTAIAALLAETRKAKATGREKERGLEKEVAVTKAMGKLDIYEFTGSSPHLKGDIAPREAGEIKASLRVSRRNSAIPRDILPHDDGEASDLESSKRPDISTHRRRQSTVGLRNSSSASNDSTRKEDEEKRLKRQASAGGMPDSGSKADRISARRRSMML